MRRMRESQPCSYLRSEDPFLYYGDEIGMEEATLSTVEHRDPWGDNVEYLSRDGCRTPLSTSVVEPRSVGADLRLGPKEGVIFEPT